jgi:hypothetical protein
MPRSSWDIDSKKQLIINDNDTSINKNDTGINKNYTITQKTISPPAFFIHISMGISFTPFFKTIQNNSKFKKLTLNSLGL